MKFKAKGLTIVQKFLLFLCFIGFLAIFDSWFFIYQSREIELYDDLDYRLNDVKFSMIKLEYTLDMFVVARHFEQGKVKLISDDVKKVDKSIRDLEAIGYTTFVDEAAILDTIKYMVDDWQLIKNDFSRLNEAPSYDVVLLIHNSVDMNTYLLGEKIDKLLSDVIQSRKGVFTDIKVMVVGTVLISLLLAIVASIVFILWALTPVRKLSNSTNALLEGEGGVVFSDELAGEAGQISTAFNKVIKDVSELLDNSEGKRKELEDSLKFAGMQVEVLSGIAQRAGTTLSQNEVFISALTDAAKCSGATAAAVYISAENEKGAYRLSASVGLERALNDEISCLPPGERFADIDSSVVPSLKELDEYPGGLLKGALKERGYSALISLPVYYNMRKIGVMLYFFKETEDFKTGSEQFLRAVASFVGSVKGFIGMYFDEHLKKDFMESILHQSPLGFAVFDRDGAAIMINATLKRMLGITNDSDFVNKYEIFEDNVFDAEGFMPLIRDTYEGHTREAIINYNPTILTWYEFDGPSLRLKIRSFPIYDAGGEILSIALIYEELLADSPSAEAFPGV